MNFKIILLNLCTIISLTISLPVRGRNGLLRTPKVYNAVITTDDNLSPSRAFPLIQPYIHEQPIAFSSFNGITSIEHSFSGIYDYSNFQGNLGYSDGVPNEPKPNEKIQLRNKETPSIPTQNSEEASGVTTSKNNDNIMETTMTNKPDSSEITAKENSNAPQQLQQPPDEERPAQKVEKSPIPLNEFGLPPILVPFSSYGQQIPTHINNPYNLQPYQYQSYPLIYDSFNGYQKNPLLPPFTFYPPPGATQTESGAYEDNFQKLRSFSQPSVEQSILGLEAKDNVALQPAKSNASKLNLPPLQPFPNGDVINYVNKNKNIPDVPPPALPTSRKSV